MVFQNKQVNSRRTNALQGWLLQALSSDFLHIGYCFKGHSTDFTHGHFIHVESTNYGFLNYPNDSDDAVIKLHYGNQHFLSLTHTGLKCLNLYCNLFTVLFKLYIFLKSYNFKEVWHQIFIDLMAMEMNEQIFKNWLFCYVYFHKI